MDFDVNTTETNKVEIKPDELWLSANPNICPYPEGQTNKCNHPLHNSKPQPPWVPTSSERPCYGFHRKGLQWRWSTWNLHHGGTWERLTQKLDPWKKKTGTNEWIWKSIHKKRWFPKVICQSICPLQGSTRGQRYRKHLTSCMKNMTINSGDIGKTVRPFRVHPRNLEHFGRYSLQANRNGWKH